VQIVFCQVNSQDFLARFSPQQGDQMSFWKSRPKCSPTNFLSKLIHNW
jgi:hypothetical protein